MNELAGKKAPKEILENIEKLIEAYYTNKPDINIQSQKVSFGTSGHRGSSTKSSFILCYFNCFYKKKHYFIEIALSIRK